MEILLLDAGSIYPNKNQPRKSFDDESIRELSESIRQVGLLQPLIVSKTRQGYMIIAGERRYRACLLLGMTQIPCIPGESSHLEEIALVENLQREDLSPLDKARAISDFMVQNGLTQLETAKRLSKTRTYIANSVRILNLDSYCKELLDQGRLSEGHAKALLALKDEKKRQALADKILHEGLSVRETEKLSQQEKKFQQGISSSADSERIKLIRQAEERLTDQFGSKVQIQEASDKTPGHITIEYYSEAQLIDIVDRLLGEEMDD